MVCAILKDIHRFYFALMFIRAPPSATHMITAPRRITPTPVHSSSPSTSKQEHTSTSFLPSPISTSSSHTIPRSVWATPPEVLRKNLIVGRKDAMGSGGSRPTRQCRPPWLTNNLGGPKTEQKVASPWNNSEVATPPGDQKHSKDVCTSDEKLPKEGGSHLTDTGCGYGSSQTRRNMVSSHKLFFITIYTLPIVCLYWEESIFIETTCNIPLMKTIITVDSNCQYLCSIAYLHQLNCCTRKHQLQLHLSCQDPQQRSGHSEPHSIRHSFQGLWQDDECGDHYCHDGWSHIQRTTGFFGWIVCQVYCW